MTTTQTTVHQELRARIEQSQARVGVIGLGYVGLPLAHALHQGGLPVIGFDIDPGKPKAIKEGKNYLCLLYTSPSPRDLSTSRMPSSA